MFQFNLYKKLWDNYQCLLTCTATYKAMLVNKHCLDFSLILKLYPKFSVSCFVKLWEQNFRADNSDFLLVSYVLLTFLTCRVIESMTTVCVNVANIS